MLVYRLLSEVDEKLAKASTGCDDKDFVDVIFTDLIAVLSLPPEVRRAYRSVAHHNRLPESNCYLRHEGYIFAFVCLFVCLSVSLSNCQQDNSNS